MKPINVFGETVTKKPDNHPNPLLRSSSNEWETPWDFFKKLNLVYNFTLDPCSTDKNTKCLKHYTIAEDGLRKSWKGETVFMNPPYGREIGKWIQKAHDESFQKNTIVVCLIPSRTDTIYWHHYCMKGEVIFIKGRLKFTNRTFPTYNEEGSYKISPATFPSAIVIFSFYDKKWKRKHAKTMKSWDPKTVIFVEDAEL
jgi:site-specific DNA-methyltransferase (adenine-specific)